MILRNNYLVLNFKRVFDRVFRKNVKILHLLKYNQKHTRKQMQLSVESWEDKLNPYLQIFNSLSRS